MTQCSLCKAQGATKATCPLNKKSANPNFEKHNVPSHINPLWNGRKHLSVAEFKKFLRNDHVDNAEYQNQSPMPTARFNESFKKHFKSVYKRYVEKNVKFSDEEDAENMTDVDNQFYQNLAAKMGLV